ncbi:hypothetical protein [Nitratireductor soli]|nr:hypothetical protein [Nitratireductor soli]
MGLLGPLVRIVSLIRGFLAPRYHPERHYMRGPGPACAKRGGSAHA